VTHAADQLCLFGSIAKLISGNKPDGLPGALAELEALIQRPYTATRLFRSRLACFVKVIILLLHP
jgi:hypothetical protein